MNTTEKTWFVQQDMRLCPGEGTAPVTAQTPGSGSAVAPSHHIYGQRAQEGPVTMEQETKGIINNSMKREQLLSSSGSTDTI